MRLSVTISMPSNYIIRSGDYYHLHHRNYMASSLPSLCSSNLCFCRHEVLRYPKVRSQSCRDKLRYPKVRSQSFRDEGKSENVVDDNLHVLGERIAELRKKESLECCRLKNGWNYQSGYDYKRKRNSMLSESIELMGFVSGALGLVFLSGSLCICLVSLLFHLFI